MFCGGGEDAGLGPACGRRWTERRASLSRDAFEPRFSFPARRQHQCCPGECGIDACSGFYPSPAFDGPMPARVLAHPRDGVPKGVRLRQLSVYPGEFPANRAVPPQGGSGSAAPAEDGRPTNSTPFFASVTAAADAGVSKKKKSSKKNKVRIDREHSDDIYLASGPSSDRSPLGRRARPARPKCAALPAHAVQSCVLSRAYRRRCSCPLRRSLRRAPRGRRRAGARALGRRRRVRRRRVPRTWPR